VGETKEEANPPALRQSVPRGGSVHTGERVDGLGEKVKPKRSGTHDLIKERKDIHRKGPTKKNQKKQKLPGVSRMQSNEN